MCAYVRNPAWRNIECIIVIECNDYGSCSFFSRNWAMNLVIEQSNMMRHDLTSMSCNLICFAQADIGSEPSGGAFPTRALLLSCQARRDERNWWSLQSMQDIYISNLQQHLATWRKCIQELCKQPSSVRIISGGNWQIANLLMPAISSNCACCIAFASSVIFSFVEEEITSKR